MTPVPPESLRGALLKQPAATLHGRPSWNESNHPFRLAKVNASETSAAKFLPCSSVAI